MKAKTLILILPLILGLLFLLIIAADQQKESDSKQPAAVSPLDQKSPALKGDCNADGRITLQDAIRVELMAAGKMAANSAADLNQDSKISREDVELLLQIIGEELLLSSFDKKDAEDIEESWQRYNDAFRSYIKELQVDSSNANKKKESMKHYIEAYYRYIHSIGYKPMQNKGIKQKR